MIVGQIVQQAIAAKRALSCEHAWVPYSATEEQCQRCTVIATAEGKARLAALSARATRPAPNQEPAK